MPAWAEGPPEEVAPRLLGAVLRHGGVAVRLTEVEAYGGPRDPGSHAFRGPTARNRTMFGPPGRLYVYLSYGMHHCVNLVTGPDGEAGAVLLRAGEVVEGLETARSRRGGGSDRDLARGPGRLGQALGLSRDDDGAPAQLRRGSSPERTSAGPRVGLSRAADVPWRFWITGDRFVSAYTRSPRAPRAPEPRDRARDTSG